MKSKVLIDSPITRVHAYAPSAPGSSPETETLGRSKGGFTTKIHAITDALGKPLDFILTAGQKGYDSDVFVQTIQVKRLKVVIPSKSNRNHPRICDWVVYKERCLIECFFNKLGLTQNSGNRLTGLERCQGRTAHIQRNPIACAFLVRARLKELARSTGRPVYQLKQGLLSDCLIQQLKTPPFTMRLA
jgi:transposase